jgi:hypothetical protein
MVAEFPHTDAFTMSVRTGATTAKTHLDAGYVYKRNMSMGMTDWVYDGRWCGYIGSEHSYLPMSKASLDSLAALAHITLPVKPTFPRGDAIGDFISRFIVAPLLILAVLYTLLSALVKKLRGKPRKPEASGAGAAAI